MRFSIGCWENGGLSEGMIRKIGICLWFNWGLIEWAKFEFLVLLETKQYKMCERLLIWCFICCWNCIGKEINVNNIRAFIIVLILNFMLGIWCGLFFIFLIQILILGMFSLKKKKMLILAMKESWHFFNTKIIIFFVAYDIHIKWYFLTHLSFASLIYISNHTSLLL